MLDILFIPAIEVAKADPVVQRLQTLISVETNPDVKEMMRAHLQKLLDKATHDAALAKADVLEHLLKEVA